MKGKKILIVVIVCILIAVLVGLAIKNKPQEEDTIGGDKMGMRVEVERITTQDIQTKISTSGKLEAVNTQKIYLDAGNKIVSLNKEVGDTVQKGEVILVLDKEAKISNQNQLESLQVQLSAAQKSLNDLTSQGSKGEILSAESNIESLKNSKSETQTSIKDKKLKITTLERDLKKAEEDLQVNESLLKEGFVSEKEVNDLKDTITDLKQQLETQNNEISISEAKLSTLDLQIQNAQYNLDVLLNKEADKTKQQSIIAKQAEIKQLETEIADSKMSLDKKTTEIVAPISGVITELPIEEGMTVAAGAELMTIIDPSKLKVECEVSPYYAPDLKLGLDATLKYTGSKTIEVPGKLTKIAAVANVKTTSNGETTFLPVDIEVAEPGDIIKPGFSVDVKIITNARKGVCVAPLLSVLEEDENEYYVYVVKEDGSLEKISVTQGLSTGVYIEVEGVNEGELIVSNPSDELTEDTKVSYEKTGDM